MIGSPYFGTYLMVLLQGALATLQLSLVALAFGTGIGLVAGLMRASGQRGLRWLAGAYVEIFRSIPILLQLFFVYYALPLLVGLNLSTYQAATLALSLYCGSYMTEVVRAGIQAVSKTQWEASYSLGLRYVQALRYVILPQALRIVIPPAINVCVFTIKDSSLASIIGYVELTGAGVAIRESNLGHNTYDAVLVVAAMYFVMNYAASLCGQFAHQRLRI